jgi:hypothetical protein
MDRGGGSLGLVPGGSPRARWLRSEIDDLVTSREPVARTRLRRNMNVRHAAPPSQWGSRVSEYATEKRRILVDRDPYPVPFRRSASKDDRLAAGERRRRRVGPGTRIILLPAWLHGEGCATLPVRWAQCYQSLAMSTVLAFGMLLAPGTCSGGSANPRRSGR